MNSGLLSCYVMTKVTSRRIFRHYRRLTQKAVTDDELELLWKILEDCSAVSSGQDIEPKHVPSSGSDDGTALSGVRGRGRTASDVSMARCRLRNS